MVVGADWLQKRFNSKQTKRDDKHETIVKKGAERSFIANDMRTSIGNDYIVVTKRCTHSIRPDNIHQLPLFSIHQYATSKKTRASRQTHGLCSIGKTETQQERRRSVTISDRNTFQQGDRLKCRVELTLTWWDEVADRWSLSEKHGVVVAVGHGGKLGDFGFLVVRVRLE